jgi:hypothetical protein
VFLIMYVFRQQTRRQSVRFEVFTAVTMKNADDVNVSGE